MLSRRLPWVIDLVDEEREVVLETDRIERAIDVDQHRVPWRHCGRTAPGNGDGFAKDAFLAELEVRGLHDKERSHESLEDVRVSQEF